MHAEFQETTRKSHHWRRASVLLAGSLVAVGVAAPLAVASTAKAAKAADPYAPYYKELSTLESGAPSGASLIETGSSLFYPLFSQWASTKPLGITVQTASTGSGTGQSSAEKGTADIGASDSYLPPSATGVINVPVVVSAQQVDYNIPGLSKSVHLHLNADVLNNMYNGKITTWNNPAITKINKGVKLPSTPIVPIHRSDSSGDTFLFTSYLAAQDSSSWVNAGGGPENAAVFPNVSSALGESGNQNMLKTCTTTPGCVAYIGSSYLRQAQSAGLGVAELLNGYKSASGSKGNYVYPEPQNILGEVQSETKIPASGTVSLEDLTKAKFGYPIVNFEYAVVKSNTPNAAAVKALLAWGMDPRHGASTTFLAQYYFHALLPNALKVSLALLKSISS